MEERRGITSDAEERGELLGPIVEPEGRRLLPSQPSGFWTFP
jgi:hypothetical protein